MPAWPHGPIHLVSQGGTYIVTAATFRKQPLFGSHERLRLLCEALMDLVRDYDWKLQAWAVFPNHYHFIASSATPGNLADLIRRLHAITAMSVNGLDRCKGRQVWFQYWDTLITTQRSYFARLRYVHENALRHGVVARPANYPWCSAGWFDRTARPAFRKTVLAFPCDRVSIPDSFEVNIED